MLRSVCFCSESQRVGLGWAGVLLSPPTCSTFSHPFQDHCGGNSSGWERKHASQGGREWKEEGSWVRQLDGPRPPTLCPAWVKSPELEPLRPAGHFLYMHYNLIVDIEGFCLFSGFIKDSTLWKVWLGMCGEGKWLVLIWFARMRGCYPNSNLAFNSIAVHGRNIWGHLPHCPDGSDGNHFLGEPLWLISFAGISSVFHLNHHKGFLRSPSLWNNTFTGPFFTGHQRGLLKT